MKFLKTNYRQKKLSSPLLSPSLDMSSIGRLTNQSPRDLLCDNHFQGKVILFNRDFGSKLSLFDLMTSSKVPIKPPSFRVINGTIIGTIIYIIGASISSSRKK